jgi:hypothetical protein
LAIPFDPKLEMPNFRNSWLQRFEPPQNPRGNSRRGQAGRVTSDAEEEMSRIRQVIKQYLPKDVFNCDETGLNWRMIPDQSLASPSIPGREKENDRITLHFCTNSDASERLPVWIVGTAKKPRAFQAAGINIENLGCYWRHNKNACMTAKIFEEWLFWFDKQMEGRHVLLLMDNFSSHEIAVKDISSRLQSTLVIWLPVNPRTNYQPLDQGIIRTWKAYWKRQWLFFMMKEYARGYNPITTVTILNAIRWAMEAWQLDLSNELIQNCFTRALAGQFNKEVVSTQLLRELQVSLDRLASSYIRDVMTLEQFLNPPEEQVVDNLDNLDSIILSQFTAQAAESDDNDDGYEVLPKISASEALECLYKVRLFEEQQPVGNQRLLNSLLHYEQKLVEKKIRNQHQTDVRNMYS